MKELGREQLRNEASEDSRNRSPLRTDMYAAQLLIFLLTLSFVNGGRFPECGNLEWMTVKMNGTLPDGQVECLPGGGLKDDENCDSRLMEECIYSININKYICCTPKTPLAVPVCPDRKGHEGHLWPSPLGYPCYDENFPCVAHYSRLALCVRSAGDYDGLVCCSYTYY